MRRTYAGNRLKAFHAREVLNSSDENHEDEPEDLFRHIPKGWDLAVIRKFKKDLSMKTLEDYG